MRNAAQRRFARRIFFFFVPLLIIVAVIESVLWETGESWPVARVARHQREHPEALFMRAILDQGFYAYKLHAIETSRPKILVLGSSRVMEFRKEMFGAGAGSFYNAGGMIQDLGDLNAFALSLSNQVPEVVILGLDLWWFNSGLQLTDGFRLKQSYDAAMDWQAHVKAFRRFKSGRVRRPALQAAKAGGENIGIQARNSEAGFRSDGSMHYSFPIPTNWDFVDREKPTVPERIREQSSQFLAQNGPVEERLALLDSALESFANKGALVVGFLPPFSSEAAHLLATSPRHSNLWNEVRTRVPAVFSSRGLPFFDASVTTNLNLNDSYLIDGMHAAETFHLHLLLHLLKNPRLREKLGDLEPELARMVESPGTNPWHPDYGAADK